MHDADREFGTELRRGLLIMLRAVERRYGLAQARPTGATSDGGARRPPPLDAVDPAEGSQRTRALGSPERSRRPLHKEFATTV